ncbi:MAG: hypothetical protein JWP69_1595 [Flaviaesturariibacter sp.]|nr:hypothetical protein [Flaviaesturariibacter sp.]
MEMYFVALVLPEELNQKVLQYKHWMLEHFGCKVGLKSPAHITLVPPFWMAPEKQSVLQNDLDELALSVSPFEISTNGFAAFKPRTIFIQPALTPALAALKRMADNLVTSHPEYGAKTDMRPFHPHITIATRDLSKGSFSEAWSHFETKKFGESWQTEGISLLRHNKKNWDVVHTSQFLKD